MRSVFPILISLQIDSLLFVPACIVAERHPSVPHLSLLPREASLFFSPCTLLQEALRSGQQKKEG